MAGWLSCANGRITAGGAAAGPGILSFRWYRLRGVGADVEL